MFALNKHNLQDFSYNVSVAVQGDPAFLSVKIVHMQLQLKKGPHTIAI